MYRRILVAVDGSDTSNLALQEAVRLAAEQQAALRLVHVVDETPVYMAVEAPYQVAQYQEALREGGKKVLAACAAAARQGGREVETNLIIIENLGESVGDAIEKEAKDWSADLIVVGTHGRRGFRHLLLGSVAEGVIRVASKPVLLIRGA